MDETLGELILKPVNPSGKAMKRTIVVECAFAWYSDGYNTYRSRSRYRQQHGHSGGNSSRNDKDGSKGTKMRLNLTAFSLVVVRVKK